MITKMTPNDINLVNELLKSDISLSECARKFDINRLTLRRNLKSAIELGLSAYSFGCLVDIIRPICSGKTLSECYRDLKIAGVFHGGIYNLRFNLKKYNVEYAKIGTDVTVSKYSYEGVSGLGNIAKKHGMHESTVFSRLQEGYSIHDAVTMPPQPRHKYEHGDLLGADSIARHFGVSRAALSRRLATGQGVLSAVSDIKSRRRS